MIYKLKKSMNICENCGIEHNGDYGSGRFCKKECSRSFSTRFRRDEISRKISLKLLEKFKDRDRTLKKICGFCKCEFEVGIKKKRQIYCSRKCVSKIGGSSKKKDTSKMGGIREGGGRSKSFEYINVYGESMKLNVEEIRIAEILDSSGLKWKRNYKGFEYSTELGSIRKFYPDFHIESINVYVEYKGWLTDEMRFKMKSSRINNNINLLVVVGDDPRFKNDGMSISGFEKIIRNAEQLKEAAGLQNLA
jgi:hypothetical protein